MRVATLTISVWMLLKKGVVSFSEGDFFCCCLFLLKVSVDVFEAVLFGLDLTLIFWGGMQIHFFYEPKL